jgi:motA/tolQ/exbB proton channel
VQRSEEKLKWQNAQSVLFFLKKGITPILNWPHLNPTSASPPAPLQGERGVVCHVDVILIGMGGFVIASKMTQAGMGIQMLIGAGNFVIALIMVHDGMGIQMLMDLGSFIIASIMMYGVIGIPMLMNTGSFVVTQHITPLSPWRGAGGQASVGLRVRPVLVLLKSKFPHLDDARWGNG